MRFERVSETGFTQFDPFEDTERLYHGLPR